jgi:hypothetical protein
MADPSILGPYRQALPRGQGETVAAGTTNVPQLAPALAPPAAPQIQTLGTFGPTPGGSLSPAPPQPPGIGQVPAPALEALKRDAALMYAPMIQALQSRRRQTEADWLLYQDCWKGTHRRQGFKGEWFNHYIPAGRRALEKFITRTRQMLFPSPDFFEVYPAVEADPQQGAQAEAWKNFLLWRLTRVQIRQLVDQALRTFGLYQRAILKTYLDVEDIPGEAWPSVRVVDPFMFYVWPETATTIPQIQVCVEHTMMPYQQYQRLAAQGVCDPIASGDLLKPDWPYHYVARLGASGMTPPTDTGAVPPGDPTRDPQRLVSMSEVWARDGAAWTQMWLVWNVQAGPRCTRLKPGTPLAYQMAIGRPLAGEQYTNSMMADLEPLNVVLNDQYNMTLEGQATQVFPPAIVDPDLVAKAESLVFRPRAKWLASPAGVKWMDMPNMMGPGAAGIQMTFGLIDQFAANSPLAEGTMSRGMPRAGFAVSSLIQLAMSDVRQIAELFEDALLTPLLRDMARLTLVGVPPQQIAQIPGAEALAGMRLPMAALLGGYSFRWVGSLQSQDQQVRAQRMLTLLGQFAKIYPSMRQNGWDIDFATLGKRLWRDGLGERGADTIILRSPPPAPTPPQSEPPKISVTIPGDLLHPALAQALALSGQPGLQAQMAPPSGAPPGQPPAGPPAGPQAPGPGGAPAGGPAEDQAQITRLLAGMAGGPSGGQMNGQVNP